MTTKDYLIEQEKLTPEEIKKGIKTFHSCEGLVILAINKYKYILRTKDEFNDLYQEAYINYVRTKNYAMRKYDTVPNFPALFITGFKWELDKLIESKYKLIKKKKKSKKEKEKDIAAGKTGEEYDKITINIMGSYTEIDRSDNSSEEDIRKIEGDALIEDLLSCLDIEERYIIIKFLGLNCQKMTISKIAKSLNVGDCRVKNCKAKALLKLRHEAVKQGLHKMK